MSGPRVLAALLVALGLVTTALLRLVPAAAAPWARAALLLGLPLAVGAAGTLLVKRRRRRPFPAEVAVPSLKYLPFVLVLLALDIAPVAFGAMAGQFAFVEAGATLSGLRAVAILFGLPAVIFVWTVGWEWGLRARLYAPWADAGRPRRAFAVSVIAGTVLSLPALAPGFAAPERSFVLAGLAAAAVREGIAVRLFRRGGMLLSGTFRGLAAGFEALVAADRMSYWAPLASYFAVLPEAQWLRLAGPLAAALLTWGVLGALDRRDARRRREP